MKWVLVLLAALSLACGASPALAHKGDTWFGFQAGGSSPSGEFEQAVDPGFEAGWQLTHMDSEHTGVGIDLAYHKWGEDRGIDFGSLTYFGQRWRYRLSILQATGHVLVDFRSEGAARPYVKVGGGIYWLAASLVTPWGDIDETDYRLGYNVGAGLNIQSSRAYDFGIGGTFHTVQMDGEHWEQFFTVGMSLRSGPFGR